MGRLTFVDAGVLIAAARGTNAVHEAAMQVLDDPECSFVSSPFVRLEVLPKALHNQRTDEAEFYETFFGEVARWSPVSAELVERAFNQAVQFGLSALDALHVASALESEADEIVTGEKPTGLPRVTSLPVRTIRP